MISNTQLVSASLGAGLQAYTTSNAYQSAMSSSIQNIESAIQLRNTQRTIFEQQGKEINEALGHKLTANDLQTIQAAARLKAATAETGTSGGTTALASVEPYVIGARNRANLIQGSRNQQLDLARRNIMSRLDAQNKISNAVSDIPSGEDITLGMLSSMISGVGQGINIGGKIDSARSSSNALSNLGLSMTNMLTTDNNVASGYDPNKTYWITDE